jgi:cytochrome c553
MALALGACSNVERSRDLHNPNVSGSTLAAQVCSVCHGGVGNDVNGNSVNPTFPNLAGQQKDYIYAELVEFREHTRQDDAARAFMWGIAGKLTDKQMDALADYFSKQPPMVNHAHGSPAMIAEGQKIFAEGKLDKGVPACQGCHGEQAYGIGPIPRLAGQHADYLYKQLMIFNTDKDETDMQGDKVKDTDLQRPHAAVMEGIASGLTTHEKWAVATYIQSLK